MEPAKPFVVPINYYDAKRYAVFPQNFTQKGHSDTIVFREYSVRRVDYDMYMSLLNEYIRKHEELRLLMDNVNATRAAIDIKVADEKDAYDAIVRFVENYGLGGMEVENPGAGGGGGGDDDDDGTNRFALLPADVIRVMVLQEIEGFATLDEALGFVTLLAHTNKAFMEQLFSKDMAVIWQKMIVKYYVYTRFVDIESLGIDFFTEKYLGLSPLLSNRGDKELGELKSLLVGQITAHSRHHVDIGEVSEAYLLFMYMTLWRKDTLQANRFVKIHASFGCYYHVADFLYFGPNNKKTRYKGEMPSEVGRIEVLQFHGGDGGDENSDLSIYIDNQVIQSTERLTSVIPLVYYGGSNYTELHMCLLLNRSRLVFRIDKGEWRDLGDVSLILPEIRRCEASEAGGNTVSVYRIEKDPAYNDPYVYIRCYMVWIQPLVIYRPGDATSTIAIINFPELVERMVRGPTTFRGYGPDVLMTVVTGFKGHIIGCRIYGGYKHESSTGRETDNFYIGVCSYHKNWVRIHCSEVRKLVHCDGIVATLYGHKILAVNDIASLRYFTEYNYRLWDLFDRKGNLWILTPDLKFMTCGGLSNYYNPLYNNMKWEPTLRKVSSIEIGDEHPERSTMVVDAKSRHVTFEVHAPVYGAFYKDKEEWGYKFGWNKEQVEYRRFKLSIDEISGDISLTIRGYGFAMHPLTSLIAQKLNRSYNDDFVLSKTPIPPLEPNYGRVYRQHTANTGVRVLVSTSRSFLLYENSPPVSRDKLGYIGQPYSCLMCGNTENIGHEVTNIARVFCLSGECQRKYSSLYQ